MDLVLPADPEALSRQPIFENIDANGTRLTDLATRCTVTPSSVTCTVTPSPATSSGRPAVLVEHPAKPVPTLDWPGR